MWADAVGQIFFSLGVCMGVMTSYASYNRKNKPIIRDVFVISFGNCLLSFFAGFAVFSVVGYLHGIDAPVKNNTSSSGLAFVAYPAAAETMPGSNFWILLLGLTLFTLGIDTAFSLVEAISTVIYDTEKGKAIPRKLSALVVSSSDGSDLSSTAHHGVSLTSMLLIVTFQFTSCLSSVSCNASLLDGCSVFKMCSLPKTTLPSTSFPSPTGDLSSYLPP
jgi:SNF family Na+-dependent transporter